MAERGNIQSLNIAITANPEGLKKGLDDAVKAVQAGGEKLDQQSKRLATSMNTWRKSVDDAGVAATRKQRALFNLAAAYEDMGEKGAASLRTTLREAGAMKDRLDDLKLAVEAGHMEGKIKVFGQAIQSTIGIIAGAEGAMHMLGLKTDDAQKVAAKLQSLFAMGNAIGSVIALRDQMQALAITSGAVNTAMKVFQTIMRPGPMLLIGAAITAISLAFQEVPKPARKVNEELKAMQGLQESLTSAAQNQLGKYTMLTDVLTSNNSTLEMRQTALKKLQEMMPAYFSNLDLEKSSHDQIRQAVESGTKALRDRAMAQAIEQRMTDLANKEVGKRIELEQKQRDFQKFDPRKGEVEFQKARSGIATLQIEIATLEKEREQLLTIAKSVGTEFNKALDEGMTGTKGGGGGTKTKAKPKEVIPVIPTLELARQGIKQVNEGIQAGPKIELPPIDQEAFAQQLAAIDYNEAMSTQLQRISDMQQSLGNALNNGVRQVAGDLANSMGELMQGIVSGADEPLKTFGQSLLKTFAGFMATLGQAMIAAGLASDTFKKFLLAKPALAIAAGAALVIAAGAVRGLMRDPMGGQQSEPAQQPQGIRPFATGGIVSGPTLGLIGEYPGAKSNPEVVAPLSKLKSMLGGGMGGNLVARISGQDLLVMLDRAETYRGRVR